MTVEALYNTTDNRVVEAWDQVTGVTVHPESGQTVVELTDFTNRVDITNRVTDYVVSGNTLVHTPVALSTSDRDNAKLLIDNTAETIRLKYITAGSAQALVYQEKGEQAADYVVAGYPADLTGYPFIQAEINATGKSKEAAADDILTQKSAWIVAGAAIEEARLAGKKAVDDANNESEINTARDNAITALEAI